MTNPVRVDAIPAVNTDNTKRLFPVLAKPKTLPVLGLLADAPPTFEDELELELGEDPPDPFPLHE